MICPKGSLKYQAFEFGHSRMISHPEVFKNCFIVQHFKRGNESHFLVVLVDVQGKFAGLEDELFVRIPNEREPERFLIEGPRVVEVRYVDGKISVRCEIHLAQPLFEWPAENDYTSEKVLDGYGTVQLFPTLHAARRVRIPAISRCNVANVRLRCLLAAKEAHYFIGEKSLGRIYVESTFSTSLSVCSDFNNACNPGSANIASQFFFASSRLV